MEVGFHALIHPPPTRCLLVISFLYDRIHLDCCNNSDPWLDWGLSPGPPVYCMPRLLKIRHCQKRGISARIPVASSAIYYSFFKKRERKWKRKQKSKQSVGTKSSMSKQPINKEKKLLRSRELNWPASPSRLFSCQNSSYGKTYAWPRHFLFWKHFLLQKAA